MIQNDIMELRVSSTAYFQNNNFMAEIKRAYRTYIAVNIERSRYMILRYEDIQQCLTQSLTFCELRLPIYPINLSRLCIVSIFMNEKEGVDKYCQMVVRVNQLLLHSSYIADGFYAIATNKPIQLTQACK